MYARLQKNLQGVYNKSEYFSPNHDLKDSRKVLQTYSLYTNILNLKIPKEVFILHDNNTKTIL